MKILLGIAATGIVTALLLDNFPWWNCGIIAFIVGFALRLKTGPAFIAGFTSVALTWGILAGWIDAQNASLLSGKIGELFGGLSPFILVIITAIVGGLVGGFGATTGAQLANFVLRSKAKASSTIR
ncbi:MAG TPA: hypothetical protein VI603_16655 [Saprospiraceae bacterium]|nr:hypothetical protein [Saprospiraceae bacterium]